MRARILLALALAVIGVVGIWLGQPDVPSAPNADQRAFVPADVAAQDAEEATPTTSPTERARPHARAQRSSDPAARDPEPPDTRSARTLPVTPPETRTGPTIIDARPGAPLEHGTAQAGSESSDSGDMERYLDVDMGPRTWMATMDPEQARALEEDIQRTHEVTLREVDRQRDVRTVHQDVMRFVLTHATSCMTEARARGTVTSGRLLVGVEVSATGRLGIIERASIVSAVDLEDPELLTCVTASIQGQTFPTEVVSPTRHAVELPLFL